MNASDLKFFTLKQYHQLIKTLKRSQSRNIQILCETQKHEANKLTRAFYWIITAENNMFDLATGYFPQTDAVSSFSFLELC